MTDTTRQPLDILILGGGFGGVYTALHLERLLRKQSKDRSVRVTLVSRDNYFLMTPLLFEAGSGVLEPRHTVNPIRPLLKSTRFVEGEVERVDFDRRVVMARHESGFDPFELPFDHLVFALGGITNYVGVEGAKENSMPFRKLQHADNLRARMVAALDRIPPDMAPQDVRREVTFAVVGAGASGCELSTKMADLLNDAFKRRALQGEPRVLVIEMSDRVVPGMGDQIREFVDDALHKSRVEVHTKTRVVKVEKNAITFEHEGAQESLNTAAVVWTGGVKMNPVIEHLDAEKNKRGLLLVKPTLQLSQHVNVFALGDIAFYPDATPTLAGTAQLAFQQASLAGDNIKSYLEGKEMKTRHFEELGEAISLGTERAAVLTGGKAFGGALARQARFALYTSRLPTWHHRLRVGASWFFEGTTPQPLLPLGMQR